ncbi:winged helix-turn-helix domain-containing protein [Vibrio sp.]|uniref:winged helix-turn-helix domain-containing protein n=1 Tax=Vibrio sp. TaxID=678 RepID=UPI003D136C5C
MSNIGIKFNLAERFTFDPNSNSLVDLEDNNELTRLGSNESRILLLLCERPNEVITRNELHEFVWREQGFEVDDSSLTQAISTLRKMLKDSTKSPQFVKTVPKRGYQLICSVNRIAPLFTNKPAVEELSADEATLETPDNESLSAELDTSTAVSVEPPSDKPVSPRWLSRLLPLLAILLPVIVYFSSEPSPSEFRQLGVYNEVPVKTPFNHPELDSWLPTIEQCLNRYSDFHGEAQKPQEVIATGGQNNDLVLNYIHSLEQSGLNFTVRIYAGQKELKKVCK